MSLLTLQSAFRDEIVADDDGLVPSSAGMAIYRDAYRGRLLAALESSFERTRRWTGEETFAAAACHYILTRPPVSWTLDDYGADFPELLAALFTDDPEVSELGWLEWRMSQAFAALDRPTLDPAALAATCRTDAEWDRVSFEMAAGFAMRPVATNCVALWAGLTEEQGDPLAAVGVETGWLLVWRHGLTSRYRLTTKREADALGILVRGGTLGKLAMGGEADQLGVWLAQWFSDGIFAAA